MLTEGFARHFKAKQPDKKARAGESGTMKPVHTFDSVVTELVDGLRSGKITLDNAASGTEVLYAKAATAMDQRSDNSAPLNLNAGSIRLPMSKRQKPQ